MEEINKEQKVKQGTREVDNITSSQTPIEPKSKPTPSQTVNNVSNTPSQPDNNNTNKSNTNFSKNYQKNPNDKDKECYYCHFIGHTSRDCRKKMYAEQQRSNDSNNSYNRREFKYNPKYRQSNSKFNSNYQPRYSNNYRFQPRSNQQYQPRFNQPRYQGFNQGNNQRYNTGYSNNSYSQNNHGSPNANNSGNPRKCFKCGGDNHIAKFCLNQNL